MKLRTRLLLIGFRLQRERCSLRRGLIATIYCNQRHDRFLRPALTDCVLRDVPARLLATTPAFTWAG